MQNPCVPDHTVLMHEFALATMSHQLLAMHLLDGTLLIAGAAAQHEDRWHWAQPPQLRNASQSAAAQRHTVHPSAAQAQAAPAAAAAAPVAAAPAAQPKVKRRAIMPPPSSPPDIEPVFARVHERRLKANAV
jgi:hypothetical protein